MSQIASGVGRRASGVGRRALGVGRWAYNIGRKRYRAVGRSAFGLKRLGAQFGGEVAHQYPQRQFLKQLRGGCEGHTAYLDQAKGGGGREWGDPEWHDAGARDGVGGTLGILIPPSIILMIYGILTQTNIGELFIAGVIPGLLGLAMYMLAIYLVAIFKPDHAPRGERASRAEKWASLKGVWPFFLLFMLIFGGIYAKFFTATEAAGMGAGFAMIISLLQQRLTWKSFKHIFLDAAFTSVMLYSVLFGAMLFAKLVSFSGLAEGILALVQQSGLGSYQLIALIMLIFLLLGCVMDSLAIILICVPLFVPIVAANGFDLIWFGIIVVVVTEIALITPPIGMNVFVLKATLPKVSFEANFRGLVPFISVDLVRLVLLIAVPGISLSLVHWMA